MTETIGNKENTISQNGNIIELKGVSYVYGKGTPFEKYALKDFNCGIERGVVTGIIGHTGSGKSTLVQLLNGLLKPTEGIVTVDGTEVGKDKSELRDLKFKVGLVFQYPEYQLFEDTVRADIAYGPKNMGLSADEINERVIKAMKFSDLDESLLEKSPFELSGGQKRRVAIAGVMAMEPKVLILDEPAAGLDPAGRREILTGVRNYREKTGSTVIIVSHSMEDIAKYCDRILVVSKGSAVKYGTLEDVFSEPELLYSIGLDIPQITKLVCLLKSRGLDIVSDIYTVEKAKQVLLSILRKERPDA